MTSALLLLDLQNEMVDPKGKVGAHGLAKIVEERGVLANARRCLDAARSAGMAVVHVRLGFRPDYADCLSVAARIGGLKSNRAAIVGEFGTEFHPDVAPADGELVITKQCVNPFFNTGLMTWLMQKGIKRLYMGGVATHLVVESTARFADDAGFAPVVIEDICAAPNLALHDHFITMIAPAVGTVSNSGQFVQAAREG
ncbi:MULTISPECIES: cysteine hydrolase family protein [unclassified Sphingobium]|uniref:cysteine hydrolase family protein n=1 Tax=unclassified Sphingobium TaxID=2611147 RepID=UPI0007702CF4|nr:MULTISPECIES: isochorismatase family cysteine hydrolase [unclassified Sphingobium]AMK24107.1 isochorismatase hydrolase [Sphingobium sp. TKS]NML89097.1 cysteine hydrolase [Sphingobium sp. TB-6]